MRSGSRVPRLQPSETDDVQLVISAVVDTALAPSADRRPTAAAINAKLRNLVRQRTSI